MEVMRIGIIAAMFLGFSVGHISNDDIDINFLRLLVRQETCQGIFNGEHMTRRQELDCCVEISTSYRRDWGDRSTFLSSHLATLSVLKCPEFEEECKTRFYAFNHFSSLVYDLYCQTESLVESCFDEITTTLNENRVNTTNRVAKTQLSKSAEFYHLNASSSIPISVRNWIEASSQLRSVNLNIDDVIKPCVQVSLYATTTHTEFHELLYVGIPFCELVWCGFDGETVRRYNISPWTCISTKCRTNITIVLVVCTIFSILITLANIQVIAVTLLYPELHHSQTIYKFSLAVSDLIVGVIVLPTVIVSLTILAMSPHDDEEHFHAGGIDTFYDEKAALHDYEDPISKEYIDAVGYFTCVSLLASLYSILFAAVDRFIAMAKPMYYDKAKANVLAKNSCIFVWVVSLIAASFPIYLGDQLYFYQAVSVLVVVGGRSSWIVYILAFFLPLIITWLLSISTFLVTKRQTKRQRLITNTCNARKTERRLAQTLSIMVGTLTVSVLPAAITSLLKDNLSIAEDLGRFMIIRDAQLIGALCLLSNSLWNFFIYNARNEAFRVAVKKLRRAVFGKLAVLPAVDRALDLFARKKSITYVNTGWRKMSSRRESESTLGNSTSSSFGYEFDHSNTRLQYCETEESSVENRDHPLASFRTAARTDTFFESVMRRIDKLSMK